MFNTVVSGTEATNEKLKENNGEELSNIIHKYWGDTIDKEFKRNSNLMFIIEPIFIVSDATGEEKLIQMNLIMEHFIIRVVQ